MSEITLQTHLNTDVTLIENSFIDHYMLKANGEYVKLYFYLLRLAAAGRGFSISTLADTFENTERDVLRALKYWQKEGLLELSLEGNKLLSVVFIPQATTAKIKSPPLEAATDTKAVPPKGTLTADKISALQGQEEIQLLLYAVSQYLGRTLSPTETSNILYFHDSLHLSPDLIEYLVQYCISKGTHTRGVRYMEKVALEWFKSGITTVEAAKRDTDFFHKDYYTILTAFGIKGRGPVQPEVDYMNQWINTFHFTMEIITTACQRATMQTQQPNFQYTHKILEDWHKKGVKHLNDIAKLDVEHTSKKNAVKTSTRKASKNKFNNFEQRTYSFDSFEDQLLSTNKKS